MSAFSFGDPIPKLGYYYAAVDKTNGETVAVSQSAVGVLVDAADKTDCREMKSNCGRSRRRSTNG